MTFKLTYSTMFDPPPELHERFETSLKTIRAGLGETHGHFIDGADVHAATLVEDLSPINTDWVLGKFPEAMPEHVDVPVGAANRAFSDWRST